MRVAVVGAGAMGSLFAAKLAVSGCSVTLVDVDLRRVAHVKQHGLQIGLSGDAVTARVPCVLPGDLGAGHDMLIILTKFSNVREAAKAARHALAPEGLVLALSNGLGVAEELETLVASQRLLIGVTDVAADLRDGVVISDGTGSVKLGLADRASGAEPVRVAAASLSRAGFNVRHEADIRIAIWEKVAFNAAFNALATIVDARVRDLDNVYARRIITAASQEAVRVAFAEGVVIDHAAVQSRIEGAFLHQGEHRPSMAQDRRTGRSTEIDAINGAVAARGERLGVPVPVNRMLTDLVYLTSG